MWEAIFRAVDAQGQAKGGKLLTALATVIEKQAKTNASAGSHRYGTKTPARRGSGPAVISGTLRRSITHEPVLQYAPGHWTTRVGTAAGFYPSYGKGRVPSSRYGYYLEHGIRGGYTYPFLSTAFKHGTTTAARALYDAAYGPGAWHRVI
jgi:hypothetical protein